MSSMGVERFTLKVVFEKIWKYNKEHIAFIDFKKTFDCSQSLNFNLGKKRSMKWEESD